MYRLLASIYINIHSRSPRVLGWNSLLPDLQGTRWIELSCFYDARGARTCPQKSWGSFPPLSAGAIGRRVRARQMQKDAGGPCVRFIAEGCAGVCVEIFRESGLGTEPQKTQPDRFRQFTFPRPHQAVLDQQGGQSPDRAPTGARLRGGGAVATYPSAPSWRQNAYTRQLVRLGACSRKRMATTGASNVPTHWKHNRPPFSSRFSFTDFP